MQRNSVRIILLTLVGTLAFFPTTLMGMVGNGHTHAPGWGLRTALAQASTFVQGFEGRPSAPQAWRPTDWDVQVHHNAQAEWKQFPPVPAQHGADCSAPPATHVAASHEQAVFVCNDHVMTAI